MTIMHTWKKSFWAIAAALCGCADDGDEHDTGVESESEAESEAESESEGESESEKECVCGTAVVTLAGNLDASAGYMGPWDPSDPAATSNHATLLTVYDFTCAPHGATMWLRINTLTTWEWHVTLDGAWTG